MRIYRQTGKHTHTGTNTHTYIHIISSTYDNNGLTGRELGKQGGKMQADKKSDTAEWRIKEQEMQEDVGMDDNEEVEERGKMSWLWKIT